MAEEPNSFGFQIQISPVGLINLKTAIKAITDYEFHRNDMVLFGVSSQALVITVRNAATGAIANLRLKSDSLINYYCTEIFTQKMLNLKLLYQHLQQVPDDITLSIFLVKGNTDLSFQFGENIFRVELVDANVEFDMVPNFVNYGCRVILRAEKLRALLNLVEEEPGTIGIVSYNISNSNIYFYVLTEKLNCAGTGRKQIGGIAPNVSVGGNFRCLHAYSLNQASRLAKYVLLGISKSSEFVLWRFSINELGRLLYLIKTC